MCDHNKEMCVCVCVYVCVTLCVCVCTHVRVCVHVHIFITKRCVLVVKTKCGLCYNRDGTYSVLVTMPKTGSCYTWYNRSVTIQPGSWPSLTITKRDVAWSIDKAPLGLWHNKKDAVEW